MAKHYVLHMLNLNGTGYSGVNQYSIKSGVSFGPQTHDGEVYPSFGAVLEQKPTISASSADVKGVLDALGFIGLPLTSFTGFWQQCENKGSRLTTSSHLKGTASSGMAVITGIRPSHNQVVAVDFDIYLITSDGITAPLAWADSQALTGTPAAVSHYTLGPCVLNYGSAGTVACQSWEYDPAVTVETTSDDGKPFPDFACIMNCEPKFTCSSPDMSKVMNEAPIAGASVIADFYLRKLAANGSRIADATAEHIKIRFASAVSFMDDQSANHPGFASSSIQVHAIKGVNPIIAIDTASVLP